MLVKIERTRSRLAVYDLAGNHLGSKEFMMTDQKKKVIDHIFPIGKVIICPFENYAKFVDLYSSFKVVKGLPDIYKKIEEKMKKTLYNGNEVIHE